MSLKPQWISEVAVLMYDNAVRAGNVSAWHYGDSALI